MKQDTVICDASQQEKNLRFFVVAEQYAIYMKQTQTQMQTYSC